MADRVRFSVSAVPIETLTDENSSTHDVLASEVNKHLGGNGDGVSLSDYSQVADVQGYKNAAVNYRDAVHTAGGARLSTLTTADFVIVKNTGHKYSSSTVLGEKTTDCVFVALKIPASSGVNGGYETSSGTPMDVYAEIAFLKPGQAIMLPCGASANSISQFGSNADDLIPGNGANGDLGSAHIYVKTVESDGSAATDGNAVEFLAVT